MSTSERKTAEKKTYGLPPNLQGSGKSPVWKHFAFEKVDQQDGKASNQIKFVDLTKAVCQICFNPLSYDSATTSLSRHLRVIHKVTIEDEQLKLSFPQASLDNEHPRAKEITRAITNMIATDLLPFNFVEHEGFRDLMRLLEPREVFPSFLSLEQLTDHDRLLDIRYVVPCRTTFSGKYLPELYIQVRDFMKQMLKSVSRLAITADCWTSRGQDAFIAISGHFVTQDWRLVEVQLDTVTFPERHTGVNVQEKIHAALESLCPSAEVTVLVTDSGSNMISAANVGDFNRIACFGHELQLCVNRALEQDESVQRLLKKCRGLVGHFRHSNTASTELERRAKNDDKKATSLVADVCTRWNSTFDMLKRISELICYANEILRQKKATELCLDSAEITMVDRLVVILGAVAEATPFLSGSSYPTLSMVYPVTFTIVAAMVEQEKHQRSKLGPVIIREIESRFHQTINHDMAVATLLDPRFKRLKWLPAAHPWRATIQEPLLKVLAAHAPVHVAKKQKTEIVTDHFSRMFDNEDLDGTEMDSYMSAPPPHGSTEVLDWWKVQAERYPTLAAVARTALAVPATSVPVERFFSQGGNIVTNKRAALSPERVAMLMFVGSNIKHVK